MDYDLKITGGTIVDGTGAPGVARRRRHPRRPRRGARQARRAARRRRSTPTAASSRPGFVDIHTHYDAQVLWDRMLTISPWHGVTTVVMGNCGFGVAPTRPAHRGLILRTLEKVEGMSLDALEAGVGSRLAVRDLPAVPRRGRAARHGDQRGRVRRPHAGAALRHGRGGDGARRDGGRDRADARHRARGDRRRRRRLRDLEGADARRLRAASRCRAASPSSTRSDALAGALARRRPRRGAGHRRSRAVLRRVRAAGARHRAAGHLDGAARRHARARARTACCSTARSSWSTTGLAIVPQVSCRPLNFDFDLEGAVRLREPAGVPARLGGRHRAARCASTATRSSARR